MAQLKFGSAGVTAREIDLTGPVSQPPTGVPAGVIGTANKGPAFVPVTVGVVDDFYSKFGKTDGKKFGPLAATEWLRNAQSLTYLRVLGVGDGKQRNDDGSVTNAGFVVGNELPRESDGALAPNPYANTNGEPGRTYFLGAFMSESLGSSLLSSAGLQGPGSVTPGNETAVPLIRGVLMAPSGVVLRLSSVSSNTPPTSSTIGSTATAVGSLIGTVILNESSTPKQDFILYLNGHKGTDDLYPNTIRASFDMTSPNYFANVLNTDPFKIQEAGHCLYTHWDIHPSLATVTGSGIVNELSGSDVTGTGKESAAFITVSSITRNTGTSTVPNFEAFTDRFTHAKSPWVISQKFGGSASNLFRLHAIDAGANVSTLYKISIENITVSTDPTNKYGTFDVVLREWNDRDMSQKPIEQHRGITLDPSSDRYISKVIGDAHVYYDMNRVETAQKLTIEGNYPSRSNLVRVEVDPGLENGSIDPTALPIGFRGIDHLVTSGSAPLKSEANDDLDIITALNRSVTPPLPFRTNITKGTGVKTQVNSLLYWGVQFEHVTSLTTPNASTLKNDSLKAFSKFFPDFSETEQKVLIGDNTGAVDTPENGIIDADRFCNNLFTLENIQVVTGSSNLADPTKWDKATYVRNGNIVTDNVAKTRKLKVEDLTQTNKKFAKFSFLMQGGSDGVNIFDRDSTELNNVAVSADMNSASRGRDQGANVKAYAKALEVMKNTVNADVQILVIPGIRHPIVTDAASEAVRERFDALYIMDIEQKDSLDVDVTSDSQQVSVLLTTQEFASRAIDNSFAAAYFPDVVMTDPTTKTNTVVPPSVPVLGALALNDAMAHPWFAPAGMTRGALSTVLEAKVQLLQDNMDVLYNNNINPLVAFPGSATGGTNPKGGVVVWGQKTLQASPSALDRVNVRRLLITIRREIRDITQTIIFEPSRDETLKKFHKAITPRLQRVQDLSGLERFAVVIDTTTTTQQDIENNTLRGKIYVQPTKTIEHISLDFVASNSIP